LLAQTLDIPISAATWGNQAISTSNDESATAFNGQRGITVGHRRVPSVFTARDPAAEEPDPHTRQPVVGVYNVMTRNN
jgi:hypothetical protein